ncbi:LacI family DNA-binding transcriptional regulator [Chitinibacter fontanus]|uniref:LacI family DNA-binding transcriptional regulator n=1 Tax=Chitinibacter fontanus TaxID=1737446 RepID=A0A7D5VB19_9NEIS|nr:LacI family DNA-binding transcriptional regulator [Chitinibacter fontanus]QLI82495.1 LacI family DNA-binding transcriptional regulator [Chitinibacter fontanus]
MSISLRELAQAAGVSVGTASRALKHQAGVSEATRQQVLGLAQSLGYDIARLQAKPIERILFLMHADHATAAAAPFYAEVRCGAEMVCAQQGIELKPFSINASSSIRRQVLQQEIDAILVVGYIEPATLAAIQALGKPLTMVDTAAPFVPSINPDNQAGAQAMTVHLIASGRQRIAFVSGSLAHHSIRLRERGYRMALFAAQRLADPALEVLIPAGLSLQAGVEQALDELLKLATPPDAIVAYNDLCALEILAQLRARGVAVPQQIAVAGFDDIAAADALQLSTIAVDKAALGSAGITQLLQHASHQTVRDELHPIDLILRHSTATEGASHALA